MRQYSQDLIYCHVMFMNEAGTVLQLCSFHSKGHRSVDRPPGFKNSSYSLIKRLHILIFRFSEKKITYKQIFFTLCRLKGLKEVL